MSTADQILVNALRTPGPLKKVQEPSLRRPWGDKNPESKKRKSSGVHSGSIHPYRRYGKALKTRESRPTIAILLPVKAVFEKRAAAVEVDYHTLISPVLEHVNGVFQTGFL